MFDTSAIVLNKVILEKNLDVWAKIKLSYIDSAYASIYTSIARHYDKYSTIPSFDELEISVREGPTQAVLASIKLIDEPDISAEVAFDALIDQYTQNQTVSLLDKFIDKLPIYDTSEIKENLANIVLQLDEKTLTTEGVYNMADIVLFRTQEELDSERVHLGLNNTFDSTLGGVARQELILIGGQRGSGKSITCSNLMVNQYEAGNACVYFTIEMIAYEVLERNLAILANVDYLGLKKNLLSNDDLLKVVIARANMFEDSSDLVKEYMQHRNRFRFEQTLLKTKKLKENNQMILIDDRSLSVSSIDLHIGKLKSRFGDNLKVVVVDYMNQVTMEGMDQFDWKSQVVISKKLKDLARKHEVVMVSPYQIDVTGEARFAKGILDAADIAMTMKQSGSEHDSVVEFDLTKIRGGPPFKFASPFNKSTLRISSTSVDIPAHTTEKSSLKSSGKRENNRVSEKANDMPTDSPW